MTATSAKERRGYWLSIAALVVALPAAIAVNSWDSASEWLSLNRRDPLTVERGASGRYAGAVWRMTDLSRLPGGSAEVSVVLAEFEATIDDPERLAEGPCAVVLTDDRGRRWLPVFMSETVVRDMHPEAADKPRCDGLAFADARKGTKIRMAETFIAPTAAKGLALSVTMADARPRHLVFR